MSHATLHDLIVATGGRPSAEVDVRQAVGRVRTDSRQAGPGDCFWALRGSSLDGHDFAGDAIRRGASCCVVEDDRPAFDGHPRIVVRDSLRALGEFARWRRQTRDAMVIGITGSVGKTTTRAMLHAVLSARFQGIQSPANYNNHVGVPLSLLEIGPHDEFAVIEMGASGTGEISGLADIARPEAAIVTAVAPAHLGRFGSIEAIEQAKGELVEALPAHGFAVLNGDDERVQAMSRRAACRSILVGLGAGNAVRPSSITPGNDTIAFVVDGKPFQIHAAGRHHVQAALACLAVAREIGLSDAEIATGLEQFTPVAGRCRRLDLGQWTILDDTYNSSPRAAVAACETLRDWRTTGRKWAVLGDMLELGDQSPAFHEQLGVNAGQCGFDGIIALGEFAGDVIRGAKAQSSAGQHAACRDLATATLLLDCWLAPGDVVLIKGSRGMRMERVIEELKLRVTPTNLPQTRVA